LLHVQAWEQTPCKRAVEAQLEQTKEELDNSKQQQQQQQLQQLQSALTEQLQKSAQLEQEQQQQQQQQQQQATEDNNNNLHKQCKQLSKQVTRLNQRIAHMQTQHIHFTLTTIQSNTSVTCCKLIVTSGSPAGTFPLATSSQCFKSHNKHEVLELTHAAFSTFHLQRGPTALQLQKHHQPVVGVHVAAQTSNDHLPSQLFFCLFRPCPC